LSQGVADEATVKASQGLPAVPYHFSQNNDIYGGAFLDTIKKYGRKALEFAKNQRLLSKGLTSAATAFPQYSGILGPAAYAASAIGLGHGGGRVSKRQLQAARNQALSYY